MAIVVVFVCVANYSLDNWVKRCRLGLLVKALMVTAMQGFIKSSLGFLMREGGGAWVNLSPKLMTSH